MPVQAQLVATAAELAPQIAGFLLKRAASSVMRVVG
jgi:hypothetical protein